MTFKNKLLIYFQSCNTITFLIHSFTVLMWIRSISISRHDKSMAWQVLAIACIFWTNNLCYGYCCSSYGHQWENGIFTVSLVFLPPYYYRFLLFLAGVSILLHLLALKFKLEVFGNSSFGAILRPCVSFLLSS